MYIGQQLLQKAAERRHWVKPAPWLIWAAILMILPGGVGLVALSQLLNIPDFNCAFVSSTDSASMRLSCAREAEKQTVDDLLAAIALVKTIPPDDPLHSEVNSSVKEWSMEILDRGEAVFQQGDLKQAIAIARQIPVNATDKSVSDRIERWQSTWSKAETIFAGAEAKIRQKNWQQAYSEAVKLLDAGNEYWKTTRYQQLMESIDNVQKENEEDRESQELVDLKKACDLALSGDVKGLEAAIAEANRIESDSPGYGKAQQLISGWRRQLEPLKDRSALDRAEQLAMKGDVTSLQAAIAEANQIHSAHTLYKEAQQEMIQWEAQIQAVENGSSAHQTEMLASKGNVKSSQAAVKTSRKASDLVHDGANERIQQWNKTVAHLKTSVALTKDKLPLKKHDRAAEIM